MACGLVYLLFSESDLQTWNTPTAGYRTVDQTEADSNQLKLNRMRIDNENNVSKSDKAGNELIANQIA